MYATPIPSVDSAVESWDSYGGLEAAAVANGPLTQVKALPPATTTDVSRMEPGEQILNTNIALKLTTKGNRNP